MTKIKNFITNYQKENKNMSKQKFAFYLQCFATGTTTSNNMIKPQVMADMVSAGLPKANC